MAWLLEPANPSARYLTLTRLQGRSKDDAEVAASRAAIPHRSPALDILQAQYPQGYWMHPGIGYSPRYRATVWQILFLAQLGMGANAALDRAVGHLFEANQREDGAFRASKEPGDTPACLNGSLLWALETLGYGERPQVRRAWGWLAREVEEHGLEGTYAGRKACPWAAIKVLWATEAVPEQDRTGAVRGLRRTTAELLFKSSLRPLESDPAWGRLTFPLAHRADVLQWLEVLGDAGHRVDPRLDTARASVAAQRLPDGSWPLERIPRRQWADFGPVGEPNKWVTIRALAIGPGRTAGSAGGVGLVAGD